MIEQNDAYKLLMRARWLAQQYPARTGPILDAAVELLQLELPHPNLPIVAEPSQPQQIGSTVNGRIYDELYCLDRFTRDGLNWGAALAKLDESWAEFDEHQPRVNLPLGEDLQ